MKAKILLTAMLVLSVSQSYLQETEKIPKNEVKITYIANTGYMVETENSKVLIDAVFNNGLRNYMIPSEEVLKKMINGDTPFDAVTALFITHGDVDHINAVLVGEFLASNTLRYVVCSNMAKNIIKNKIGSIKFDSIKNRIISSTPDLFSSIQKEIGRIGIEMIRLRHSGTMGNEENLGYLLTMDGINIFHSGDNDGFVADGQAVNGVTEYSKIGIDKRKIDLAILNRGVFWEKDAPGIEIVKKYIKPKYIVLSHLSKGDSQKEYTSVINVIKANEKDLPSITIFEKSMEIKSFTIDKY